MPKVRVRQGAVSVALALGTGAAAGLHAPEWVWIAMLVVALGFGVYAFIPKKEPVVGEKPDERPSHNVTSFNQSGGITAGTVNLAPQAKVEARLLERNREVGHDYLSVWELDLTAAYALPRLRIEAVGRSIQEVEIGAGGTGGVMHNIVYYVPTSSLAVAEAGAPLPSSVRVNVQHGQPEDVALRVGVPQD